MATESEKLIEYIQVESRILIRLDPRTKGLRTKDWKGYEKDLVILLISARSITLDQLSEISNNHNVPFFENQAVEMVTKWNELIKINEGR